MRNLSNLTIADIKTAQEHKIQNNLCPAGKVTGKFTNYQEEENYSRICFAVNNVEYGFFVDLEDRETGALKKETLEWLQSLAVKSIDDSTTFQSIINNAIGYSFEFEVRHYVSKKDQSTQHAINFRTKPVLVANNVSVETEEVDAAEDLPF